MGSNSSKTASATVNTASKAATSSARKYPTHFPRLQANVQASGGEKVGPSEHPAVKQDIESRDRAIDLDASDPDTGLAARLTQLGPVQPNPTQSNSSTYNTSPDHQSSQASSFTPSASAPNQSIFPPARQNPAVSLLTARYRLAEEAEVEFSNVGRKSAAGRQFLDVVMIRQILVMREQGVGAAEIERKMGLRAGVVGRLGRRGVVDISGYELE